MAELDTILDQCLKEIRQGKSQEKVLSAFPELKDELNALLNLTNELYELPDPVVEPNGFERIKEAVIKSSASDKSSEKLLSRFFSKPILARAAVIFLSVLLIGWGTVAASSSAVPGDFLYPVKRTAENLKVLFTISDKGEAELRIVFSKERLKEFVKKHEQGNGIDQDLLVAMLEEAKMAIEKSPGLSKTERMALTKRFSQLSKDQVAALEKVSARASSHETLALAPFIATCAQRCSWVEEMSSKQSEGDSVFKIEGWLEGCPTCPVESCNCTKEK